MLDSCASVPPPTSPHRKITEHHLGISWL